MKVWVIGLTTFGGFEVLGNKVFSSHSKALAVFPEYADKYGSNDLTIEDFEVSE